MSSTHPKDYRTIQDRNFRRERADLEKLKAQVFKMEQKNYDKLILFQSSGAWWRFGGHSAIIYYHRIAPRIGRHPNLLSDTDFYSRFKEGTVSVRKADSLIADLAKIKITLVEDQPDLKIFQLPKKFTAEEYKILADAERTKREKMNRVLVPKFFLPEVHHHLLYLMNESYQFAEKCSVSQRKYIGSRFADAGRKAYACYLNIARGNIAPESGLSQVLATVEESFIYLKIIAELQLWSIDRITRFSTHLVDVKTLLEKAQNGQ